MIDRVSRWKVSYVRFDEIISGSNKNFINISQWVNNSTDQQAGLLSYDLIYLVDVIKERHKVKISWAKDEKDSDYSQTALETQIDACRLLRGVQTNFFARATMENFFKAVSSNVTCPLKRNLHVKVRNQIFTDFFLPPAPAELRFKIHNEVVGMIKGRKGWQNLYIYELFGRYKK